MKRCHAIDILRGLGIIGVLFIHALVFNYGKIMEAIENPSLIITIIGFLLGWGGLFAIISGASHGIANLRRIESGQPVSKLFLRSIAYGGFFLLLHYVYFPFLAPGLLDREAGFFRMSLIPGLIRTGEVVWPSLNRIAHASTLIMIGWCIILNGLVLFFLFRHKKNDEENFTKKYIIIASLATLVTFLGLLRIPLYPIVKQAIIDNKVMISILLGYLVNQYYPILPYWGFSLFGLLIGIAYQRNELQKIGKYITSLAGLWFILGLIGYITLEDTMLQRIVDLQEFSFELFQLGIFILLLLGMIKVFDLTNVKKKAQRARFTRPIRRFGSVTLSLLMLEPVIVEVFRILFSLFIVEWYMNMGLCFIFSTFIVIFWAIAIKIWEIIEYKFGFEWITSQMLRFTAIPSQKAQILDIVYPSSTNK